MKERNPDVTFTPLVVFTKLVNFAILVREMTQYVVVTKSDLRGKVAITMLTK